MRTCNNVKKQLDLTLYQSKVCVLSCWFNFIPQLTQFCPLNNVGVMSQYVFLVQTVPFAGSPDLRPLYKSSNLYKQKGSCLWSFSYILILMQCSLLRSFDKFPSFLPSLRYDLRTYGLPFKSQIFMTDVSFQEYTVVGGMLCLRFN